MLLVVQSELSPREEKTHARCNTLLRISHADAMDYPDQACRIFSRRLRLTGRVGCYFRSVATGHNRGRISVHPLFLEIHQGQQLGQRLDDAIA